MTAVSTEAEPRPSEDLTGELVFTAWSALSPFGTGAAAYGAGILAGRSAVADLDLEAHPGPSGQAGLVPGFTAAGVLGRKGTRTMDRVTAIAVRTVDLLLDSCGPGLLERPERVGLVLGTGSGSVQSIMDFTRDSLTGEKPYHVDPARFPNTVMNKAAGQSAIWHGIKGPNTTIAGGWLTGLLALSYAARLYRGGHCDRVLCGAAEEYSAQRAWLEWHAAGEQARPVLGEGGAAFLLESAAGARDAGRTPVVRLLATRFRAYHQPASAGQALAGCVRAALADARVRAGGISVLAPLGAGAEEEALAEVAGGANPHWIRCRPLLGDTSAAATGFQLAAVLAAAADGRLGAGELALVTGIDRDGTVGCAVLGG